MPRTSKHPVSKHMQEELQDNFSFLISSLSSSSDIQHFFDTFLTEEEKVMLSKRLMLHLMIETGYDPTEIMNVLGMSRDTVYRHALVSRTGDNTYKAIVVKIAKRRKTKEFMKKVEKFLRPLGYALDTKTNMKARAKLLGSDPF